MTKKLLAGATALMAMGMVMNVSADDSIVPAPRKVEGTLHCAYVAAEMNTYYGSVYDGVKEEVERYGGADEIVVDYYSPTNSSTMVEEQIGILETLLNDPELDVLFFSTHNDTEFIPFLEQFCEKGVSVYLFNMPAQDVTNDAFVSLVSYDFEDAGRKCGQWIVDNCADMDVKMLYLEGTEGTHNTVRMAGFKDAIEGAENIEIVVSQCADWNRMGGQSVTENALQSNPEINVVFGPYDEMPLGAISALKDAGRIEDTIVVGYDCTEDGLAAIKKGEMAASVNTDAKQMGNHLIDTAVAHDLEGKEVDKQVFNELIVIDATNCDTIPDDNYGYSEKEKCYEIER